MRRKEEEEEDSEGQMFTHKLSTIIFTNRQSPQLNRNNSKKDEMIEAAERTMYDLIEKHTASLEMLQTEHINASDDTSHELSVLKSEVNHLKWQVDRANEMEAQNIALLEERDMFMSQLGAIENEQHDAVTRTKKEILKQEEKLEKQFKKELVQMDAKYRQVAFEGLADSKKKALLENSKLQEEIVMQKIGLVNLGERMLVEDEQLMELRKMKKLYEQQTAECSNRIAVLRRGSYAYDARMADMDVTLVRLANEENMQRMKLDTFVMSLGDTNRETARLKEKEKAAKGDAMKWKSRFIQIHNLIAAEKHRKTMALNNSIKIDRELPEGPSGDMEGGADWTFEMTKGIQAKNEIGSEEFVGLWADILQNWQDEDGDDALVRPMTRPGTNKSWTSGRSGMTGGTRDGSSTFSNDGTAKMGGVLETSESTPMLRPKEKRLKKKNKNAKSAPSLNQVHEQDDAEAVKSGNQEGEAKANILPMLAHRPQAGFWEEEQKLTKQIALDRKKAEALRQKQQAIAEGTVDVEDIDKMMNEMDGEVELDENGNVVSVAEGGEGEEGDASKEGEDDDASVAESLNSTAIMLQKARESKRLDIAATGLTKKPLGRLGSSSLLNGGERFDLSGGLRGAKEPPRKRLIQSLKRYHDPRESLKFRKEMKGALQLEKSRKTKKSMEIQSLW